ncbi:MAG: type II toxin-antitoxin system VapC family toxin [Spirochaetaceae bacterium]|nr:type II toxin-antitoxin system VapC family toxin [Spirochaetaceae bacterium]
MKVLMDTHALLWAVSGDRKLGLQAAAAFIDPETDLFFSMAGYWEICIKVSLNKLRLTENWEETIQKEMSLNGIRWLNIQKSHCEVLLNLPYHHRDPFDRLLIAQASVEKMTIMTRDAVFRKYRIPILW